MDIHLVADLPGKTHNTNICCEGPFLELGTRTLLVVQRPASRLRFTYPSRVDMHRPSLTHSQHLSPLDSKLLTIIQKGVIRRINRVS